MILINILESVERPALFLCRLLWRTTGGEMD